MSDASSSSDAPVQRPAAGKDQPQQQPAGRNGGGVLRIVLLSLLVVMLGLLGLDIYARNASKTAFDQVEAWVTQKKEASPEEVHDLLGRKPDEPLEEVDHYYVETYSWRRGNLLKKEYVKVIYSNDGGEPVLHEVVRNVEPGPNDTPNPPPPELSEEDLERLRSETPADDATPESEAASEAASGVDGEEDNEADAGAGDATDESGASDGNAPAENVE